MLDEGDGGGVDVPMEVGRSYLRINRDWCDEFRNPPLDYVPTLIL